MNFKTTLAILLIIAAAIFCFTFLSEDSEARLCVWDGDDAGTLASTAANWDTDTAPIAGDDILFDGLNATGDDACTWDLATDSFGTFTIGAGYSGVITQSSDMHITGYSQAGGTFTGVITKWIYCSGNYTISSGTFTSIVTRLQMDGINKIISGPHAYSFHSLIIANDTTVTSTGENINVYDYLKINSGVDLTVASGKILQSILFQLTHEYNNHGTINGPGKLVIFFYNYYDKNIVLGNLSIETHLLLWSVAPSRTVWLGEDSVINGNCYIESEHESNTLTIDLKGHSLSATTITVGTRGILDCGNGTITCSALTSTAGTIIEDTATWVFNDGAVVTATSGQKFYNVQMKGDCDFVNSVNVTNDLRFVDVSADYDDIDVYLDTVYSVTIPSPYTFGAEITAAAEYTYLPDVQISISQFYEDVDFSIYAYISSNLPVTYNITGTASSWLSYHEGRIVGMPPDIGNYTYTITVTHETGSTDIIMGNILVGNLDTAEYGFDIILGLIWFIILTLLMFWGYHKNVPLLQVICILMLIFSAITMLRIENFDSFNLLFVLVNSVMFILGMIRYARL